MKESIFEEKAAILKNNLVMLRDIHGFSQEAAAVPVRDGCFLFL